HGAASGALSHLDPRGGPVASSAKTLRVHQRFQQQRTMPVAGLPVVRQVSGAQRQNLAGQSLDSHPGQNQEPSVIDDPLQVALSLLVAPPDPGVSGLHLPGGRGPQQAGQFPIAIPRPVAQVGTGTARGIPGSDNVPPARAITGSPPGLPPRPTPAARTRSPRTGEAQAASVAD